MEILIASKLGGGAPLIVAAAVSGVAGLVVTWLVAAVAGPVIYADFAVFWALFFFMVSVLFGVQQEMARGVAAAGHTAGGDGAAATVLPAAVRTTAETASPWRRILATTGVVAVIVLVSLVALGPSALGTSWVAWSLPILVAVPCYVVVAAIQGALAGTDRWVDLALLLTIDAVIRLALTGVALLLGGGAAALGWATALPILLTVVIGILRGGPRLRAVRTDAVRARDFQWNTARAVFAGVGAAFFVAGFPAVLAVFAGTVEPARFATLVLVITLTRAPLLMPLSAIQSLLVVRFTRLPTGRLIRAELLVLAVVGAVGLAGAALGALIGPPLLAVLFGPEYVVTPGLVFVLVLGATAIAALYVTGPGTLARHLHTAYSLGWAFAAVVAVACLTLPLPLEDRAVLALLIGPLFGVLIHLAAQALSHRRAGAAAPTGDDEPKEDR